MSFIAHIAAQASLRRIVGFSCNQGFIFSLFYMGLNRSCALGPFALERADLLFFLFFMTLGLVAMRWASPRARRLLLSRGALIACGTAMAAGTFISLMMDGDALHFAAAGFLIGLPEAVLLASWGRSFGSVATRISVPEVICGTFAAVVLCLAIMLLGAPASVFITAALPLASSGLTRAHLRKTTAIPGDSEADSIAALLSIKVIVGTFFFGLAAGLMETYNTEPGSAAMSAYPVSMLLLGGFLLGVLSLFPPEAAGKTGALKRSYRLAVFVMMLGFLLIPVPFSEISPASGEAVTLAGYLGLAAVLASLFLVLAQITAVDPVLCFSKGFAALFGGELCGVLSANAFDLFQAGYVTPYAVVVVAGLLVLLSFMFLFTERDFSLLSSIVGARDSFDEACRAMEMDYGLSQREAEILPLALKGRTNKRIAEELFISKSTVDTHLRHIYGKVGVHNRQELIDLGERGIELQGRRYP